MKNFNILKIENKNKFALHKTKSFYSGFAMLFAVVVSSIFLAIALGISNIALKEVSFATSAKDTNDAFFAADTGAECALFNDKITSTTFFNLNSDGKTNTPTGSLTCLGTTYTAQSGGGGGGPTGYGYSYVFTLPNLGSSKQSCATVQVTKIVNTTVVPNTVVSTSIVSKGHNIGSPGCSSIGSNIVERELDVNY